MRIAKDYLGVEFTEKGIQIACISKGISQVRMKASRFIPLKARGSFYEESESAIAAEIRSFMIDNDIEPTEIHIGLPRKRVLFQEVEVPVVSESEIRQIMTYELEKHIPLSIDSVYFDVVSFGETTGTMLRVLLIAVQKRVLDRFLRVFEEAELTVHSVDVSSVAAVNSYLAAAGAKSAEVKCFVNIKSTDIVLTLFQGNKILFSRSFPVPRRTSSPAALDDKSVDAEHRREIIHQIVRELDVVSENLRLKSENNPISEIILCGIGIKGPQWAGEMLEFSRIPASFHNPLENIKSDVDLFESFKLVSAFGLAQKSLMRDFIPVNLIPPERRPKVKDQGLVITGALLGIITALFTFLIVVWFYRLNIDIREVQYRNDKIKGDVTEILRITEEYKSMKEQMDVFKKMEFETPKRLEVLGELTRILPVSEEDETKRVWLTALNIDTDEVVLRGESESPEGLIKILEDSDLFEQVQFDSPISRNKFAIKVVVSQKIMKEEELPEEFFQSEEEAQQKQQSTAQEDVSPPTPTPVAEELPDEREELPRNRGPAYKLPTKPPQLPEEEFEEEPMDEEMLPDEQFDEELPDEQPMEMNEEMEAFVDDYLSEEEDMEAAKQKLFDILQGDQDNQFFDGDLPPEAEDFIEFLQNQAEEEDIPFEENMDEGY